jgi:ketosteroid isomerase-like protein
MSRARWTPFPPVRHAAIMHLMVDEAIELVAKLGNELLALLLEVASDDLECVMVAPDYAGPRGRLTYTGPEGFVQAWREWVDAYERYSIEVEEIAEGALGQVFILARQRGTTRTGGVEVSEPAGAVWTVRDGRLVRMEFHLDPESAKRVAGLA